MPNPQDIVVRYTADIGDLQSQSTKAVKTVEKTAQKANKSVSTAAKKTQDSLAKTTAQGAEKTKSSFMAIGQAVSLLTPALGEAGGKMAMFTSSGIMGLAVMTESVKLMAEAWRATLIGAVAAAGAALGYWLSTMTDATEEIEKQKRSLYGLTEARRKDNEALEGYNKLQDDTTDRLRVAATAARLFGDQTALNATRQDALKAKLVSATIAREDLVESQKDQQAQLEREKVVLAALERQQADLVTELKEYRSSLKATGPGVAAYAEQILEAEERTAIFEQALRDKADAIDHTRVRIDGLAQDIREYTAAVSAAEVLPPLPPIPERRRPDMEAVSADDMIFGGDVEGGLKSLDRVVSNIKDHTVEAEAATESWQSAWLGIGEPIDAIKGTAMGTFQTIKQGLAASIAQVLIFGEGFEQIMSGVFASVAQMFINLVLEMMFTWVSAKITEMITGNIAAYSSIPFVGLALGLAGAAAAIAASKAMAGSEGGIGFAQGALVTGPVLAWVGEGNEDEYIAPRSDFEKAMRGSGDGHAHDIIMDGRKVGETVMKVLPGQVKRRGIRGF
jgi:hypothetical protein